MSRNVVLKASIGAVSTITTGAAAFMLWVWRSPLPTDQRLVAVGDIAAVATLLLASLAAAVALAAYAAATGPPDLSVELSNPFGDGPNRLLMRMQPARLDNGYECVEAFKQVYVQVIVTNASKWSARNPAVRIELRGIMGFRAQPEWQVVGHTQTVGITGIQWDGGADAAIHGHFTRRLPDLDFSDICRLPSENNPRAVVTIYAEGFRAKPVEIPIQLLGADDYDAVMHKRATSHAD